MSRQRFVVDIGGEGRHPEAWNLNPSPNKTLGPRRGQLIPRLILSRADAIPLADRTVDIILVERTPLSRASIEEIRRIARPGAIVILRHAQAFSFDPHRLAKEMLHGLRHERECMIGPRTYRETVIELGNFEAARSGYVTGRVDFLRVVEAQRQLITLREEQQQAIADYHWRKAELERVLGGPISSVPAAEEIGPGAPLPLPQMP